MGHQSPQTLAHLNAARSPIIGSNGRQLTDAEKAEAQKELEDSQVLKALQQEQQERDHLVRLMVASPDFDLGAALDSPEDFTKRALALAEHLVAESNKRDYSGIVAELKRLGTPVRRDLRLICERHGIEVPEAGLKPVG